MIPPYLRHLPSATLLGLLMTNFVACRPPAKTDTERQPQPRWLLTQPIFPSEASTYHARQLPVLQLLQQPDEASRQQAIELLNQQLKPVDEALLNQKVSTRGAQVGPLREAAFEFNHAAYDHALLWSLTGDAAYAEKARRILLRFAEVMPQWPLYAPDKTPHAQGDDAYAHQWDANGFWGRWYPLDLAASIPLLRAYDLIRPTLDLPQQKQIEALFHHQKEVISRFDGTGLYHNMDGYHLMALARFGLVLQQPDWIHEVVNHWRQQIERGYSSDGIYREMTIDYHRQISTRLTEALPAILNGYTDPPGYRNPQTGQRFDHLDLEAMAPATLRQIRRGTDPLLLPDGSYVNFNDSWPKRMRGAAPLPANAPALLGGAGVAKLAKGNLAVFLKFDGIRGHDHRDALNLIWYANRKEVFSGTGYRPEKKEFERKWSSATASHFTAAIDETLHFEELASLEVNRPLKTFTAQPPKNTGATPAEAAYPGASRYQNQGRLLLWNTTHPQVQAMEAEQPGSYPGKATLFRRTIVLVPFNDDEGYLVDIFRIKGGTTHDYFLRGGLDHPYTLTPDRPLQPANGTLHHYLQLQGQTNVVTPFRVDARYPDSSIVRSHLAGVSGSSPASLNYLMATAPAIRRAETAPFSLLRRSAPAGAGPLESCFVWVHESAMGQPRIRQVTLGGEGMEAIVTIELEGRRDTLLSSASDTGRLSHGGWNLHGKLGFISEANGTSSAILLAGEQLQNGAQAQREAAPVTGIVLETTKGDSQHPPTVTFQPDPAVQTIAVGYRVAHFDLSPQTRISIPIKGVQRHGERVALQLAYPAGFGIHEGRSLFYHYPGWNLEGPCRITLE